MAHEYTHLRTNNSVYVKTYFNSHQSVSICVYYCIISSQLFFISYLYFGDTENDRFYPYISVV